MGSEAAAADGRAAAPRRDASLLAVEDLVVSLGDREILHRVSFTVRPGEIVGFVGPNGSGKTTTIRAILGLYPPESGHVLVEGSPAGSAAARQSIGFALDSDGLYDGLTAAENVALFQRLYGRDDDAARVREVLALVGLAARADDDVRSFSRGMRQRAAIARALVHHPSLLVLDEPTSGIDPGGQTEIRALLQRIAETEGTAILMSSHNLEEVQRLARTIVVIAEGAVQLSGDLSDLRQRMGAGTVTVTTVSPVGDDALATVRARDDLGLRRARGAVLTFVPAPGVRRSAIVEAVAEHSDIVALTTDDASLEAMYSELVARAAQAARDDAAAAPAEERPRARGPRRGGRARKARP